MHPYENGYWVFTVLVHPEKEIHKKESGNKIIGRIRRFRSYTGLQTESTKFFSGAKGQKIIII